MLYRYTMEGTGSDGQTWTTQGEVALERAGDFPLVVNEAQRQSFMALTQGKAVYGSPGQHGCRGPYRITKLVIEVSVNGAHEED